MSHGLILYSLEAQVFVLTPVSPIQAQDGDNITLHWDQLIVFLIKLS